MGRHRLRVCAAGLHSLTNENRRWRTYTRVDGTVARMADGCRLCNNDRARKSYAANAAKAKLALCGFSEVAGA